MISYGNYIFSSPEPFVSIDEQPVYFSGKLDHSLLNISLIGEITGCDISSLKIKKRELEDALETGFQSLTIGNTGYDYVKPVGLSISESKLTKILPYSISFEAYHEKDFSNFFGISDPIDSWQYSEDDNRIVSATHTVSARGVKASATDSLQAARNFVDGRLNNFENLSLFFSGDVNNKKTTEESVNRVNNSYSVVETYNLSQSLNEIGYSGCIVRPSCRINYGDDSLSISVNGFIDGGLTGNAYTGMFTSEDATNFAKNSVKRFKVVAEDSLYGEILRGPQTFNYDTNTGANKIDFSFDFNDPTDFRTGDVLNDYSTKIEASKEDGFASASIDGKVYYNTTNDIFLTTTPENEQRYQKVEAYFSGVEPFSLLQQHYSYFQDLELNYSSLDLNPNFVSKQTTKLPFDSTIEYSEKYDNKPDLFSGILRNVSLSVNIDYPILKHNAKETIDNSFAVQELYNTKKRTSVSLEGKIVDGFTVQSGIDIANFFLSKYSGSLSTVLNDSLETGSNSISISRGFIDE